MTVDNSVPKVRLSACGILFWHSGKLIWDDYLNQRQRALAPTTGRVIRWFADWRAPDSIRELGNDAKEGELLYQLALLLSEAEILVWKGSKRQLLEEAILKAWSEWSPLVRAFHYSSRFTQESKFQSIEEHDTRLIAKLEEQPPPPAFKQNLQAPTVALPNFDDILWKDRDLLTVLNKRRSSRSFGRDPVEIAQLSALLRITAGPVSRHQNSLTKAFQTVFKTSPSGGARHPTELYLHAVNVRDLPPGIYHYNAIKHALELLGSAISKSELIFACCDQEWVADAAVILFYTSVIAREQWKYSDSAAYNALQLDVGHLNQTASLLATALGLRTTFTACIRADLIEEMLQCDSVNEFVVGCAVLGTEVSQIGTE